MKFTEMPYTHPNLEEFQTSAGELLEQIRADLKEELWQWFDEVFNLLKAKWMI